MSYQSTIRKLKSKNKDNTYILKRLDDAQFMLTDIKNLGELSNWSYSDIKRILNELER